MKFLHTVFILTAIRSIFFTLSAGIFTKQIQYHDKSH